MCSVERQENMGLLGHSLSRAILLETTSNIEEDNNLPPATTMEVDQTISLKRTTRDGIVQTSNKRPSESQHQILIPTIHMLKLWMGFNEMGQLAIDGHMLICTIDGSVQDLVV